MAREMENLSAERLLALEDAAAGEFRDGTSLVWLLANGFIRAGRLGDILLTEKGRRRLESVPMEGEVPA